MSVDLLRKHSIYTLIDPRSGKVRYVGQTVDPSGSRLDGHVKAARRGEDTYKARWIRQLIAENLVPEVEIVEEGVWSQDSCDDREEYWIACFRESPMGQLTNVLDRGSGVCGGPFSDERRVQQSVSMKKWLATPAGKKQRRRQMLDRYTVSPDRRQADTAGLRKYFSDADHLAVHVEKLKKLYDDEPQRRKVIAEQSRARWADPEFKAKTTEKIRQRYKEMKKRRRKCVDCGFVSDPQRIGIHLRDFNHSSYIELSIEGGD